MTTHHRSIKYEESLKAQAAARAEELLRAKVAEEAERQELESRIKR